MDDKLVDTYKSNLSSFDSMQVDFEPVPDPFKEIGVYDENVEKMKEGAESKEGEDTPKEEVKQGAYPVRQKWYDGIKRIWNFFKMIFKCLIDPIGCLWKLFLGVVGFIAFIVGIVFLVKFLKRKIPEWKRNIQISKDVKPVAMSYVNDGIKRSLITPL